MKYTVLFIIFLCFSNVAQALITPSGTDKNRKSNEEYAPDYIWDNVGEVNGSSGVYIGRGLAITANHVAGGGKITFSLFLNGTKYSWVGAGKMLGKRDLFMARLSPDKYGKMPDDYGATGVTMADVTPKVGTLVTLIGCGRTIAKTKYYKMEKKMTSYNKVPAERDDPLARPQYIAGSKSGLSEKTWGTNRVANASRVNKIEKAGRGYAVWGGSLALVFDDVNNKNPPAKLTMLYAPSAPTDYETHAAMNDSGAPVFANNNGKWELIGITTTGAADGIVEDQFPMSAINITKEEFKRMLSETE